MKNFLIAWVVVFAYSMYVTVPDFSNTTSQIIISKGLYAAGTSFVIAAIAVGISWGIKRLFNKLS